MIISPVGFVKH